MKCLQQCLETWRSGDIADLLQEGSTIQSRLPLHTTSKSSDEQLSRNFAKLMAEGKVKAAIRLLSSQPNSAVLHSDTPLGSESDSEKTVFDSLCKKHPSGEPAQFDVVFQSLDRPCSHPVILKSIDADLIRSVALQREGAASPSGIEARGWKRMCTSFKSASVNLCSSLAIVARRLCTEYVNPRGVLDLLSCRLIALD